MKRKRILSLALSLAMTAALLLPAAAYDGAEAGYTRTISAGAAESFLIDGDGTLWAWGENQFGQLGDGTADDRSLPVKVLERVRSVSAGQSHAYAVLEDNTLWAWGRNVSNAFPGEADDMPGSDTPVKIMDDVASASTGTCTHLAVKTDGSLWAWGRYIGNKTNKQYNTPQKIMDDVAAACAGYSHSLALKNDGTLWVWGLNTHGEAGDSSGRPRLSPAQVMKNVVSMSAGYGFSAAVKEDGSLWTWGRNSQGELGDGTLWSWDITWKWESSDPEEDAILQDTLASWIKTWGPQVSRDHSVPYRVMDGVASVCTSNNNTYALRKDGTLWAWGNNNSGDVGDGTTDNRLTPVQVLDRVEQVSAGWDHVLALRSDGSLWTWGSNLSGQLGNGEDGFYGNYVFRFSASPIQVMEGADTASPSLTPGANGNLPAQWARADVDKAIAQDFLPVSLRVRYSQTITRGEFCALAVRFYERFTGREIEGRRSFADTDDVNVEKAAALGVVSGVGGGRFSPDSPLNREQAALILTNLAKALESPLPQAAPSFYDADAISSWARTAAGSVQAAGIMRGVGGNSFAPKSTYTREQSVVTIMNLYRFMTQDG